MSVTLARPWLCFDLGGEMQVLSHTLNRPGFVAARRILWREVRNADLTPDLDVPEWLDAELAGRNARDAPCFLTSRDVRAYEVATATQDGMTATAVATVGLSNAERVGTRMAYDPASFGTINIALRVEAGVTQAALIELLALVAQARTVAVTELGHDLPTGLATGTGTDCIAVAAPSGDTGFAGMHTGLGVAAGHAVYQAVRRGGEYWMAHVRRGR
ncbi:adenosylcobinamide amidohydrolase [Lutimaribacter sp. EGI FJ00015]|uniref:Adenosylcobinamide amidohydrolase n=1 Tax=Lutimaribacter degradans TaxID=2945989 RepID=A0ACC5ZXT5_9RHOB|nr:adenosylcobinamide amidohydrolase [Lutimaribacter sp. EGI FJ00013]MCM2562990.1 adenosylcobinamide amidohydrolase [Lutimaribacter sp. EGI FJ00013]MCO0614158.1 adenosylcobinamide amidohydrolase [Lutimaribacter sp. EGI FJ00015]MCO0636135.1 adenosylcobinamide amidohydrolase [Lutimaribacter sp. EGI FJ00014]